MFSARPPPQPALIANAFEGQLQIPHDPGRRANIKPLQIASALKLAGRSHIPTRLDATIRSSCFLALTHRRSVCKFATNWAACELIFRILRRVPEAALGAAAK
jgi:hypothetical protein